MPNNLLTENTSKLDVCTLELTTYFGIVQVQSECQIHIFHLHSFCCLHTTESFVAFSSNLVVDIPVNSRRGRVEQSRKNATTRVVSQVQDSTCNSRCMKISNIVKSLRNSEGFLSMKLKQSYLISKRQKHKKIAIFPKLTINKVDFFMDLGKNTNEYSDNDNASVDVVFFMDS